MRSRALAPSRLPFEVTYDGTRLYPNFGAATTGTYAKQPDSVNNVEEVTLTPATTGDVVSVVVRADGLASSTQQKFALVVAGPLNDDATFAPTPIPPSPAPTATPTPAPSPDCGGADHLYRLRMFDAGGDGWQGATYELANSTSGLASSEGAVVASGTLSGDAVDGSEVRTPSPPHTVSARGRRHTHTHHAHSSSTHTHRRSRPR